MQTTEGLTPVSVTPSQLPVGRLQLMEVVDMLLDIGRARVNISGVSHRGVADAHLATALALIQLEEADRARKQLDAATAIYSDMPDAVTSKLLNMANIMLSTIS